MILRLTKLTVAFAILASVIFAPVALAASEGQIEGGNIYRVKNVTKNTDFTDPVKADACDVLQYWIRIHNPGPGFLTDVKVKATFPSGSASNHTSTMTASAVNADPASTSDTATVNLSSSQSLSYQSGSTQLLDASGNPIKTLPDGIVGSGVSIGNVGVSLGEKRFILFKAKISCPTTPTPTPPVKGVTTELPNTGVGNVIGLFAGASALGATGHYIVRRIRQ